MSDERPNCGFRSRIGGKSAGNHLKKECQVMNQAVETVRSARKLPQRYGIIDQRIVSEGYLKRLPAEVVSLYVFLCVVADRAGRSWYSDGRLVQQIRTASLASARRQLVEAGLIAWEPPVYTVLEVSPIAAPVEAVSSSVVQPPVEAERPATAEEITRLNEVFRKRMGWSR
jgi:hypothetical protein